MKKIIFLLAISLVASAVVLMSCSEDQVYQDNYATHLQGWMDLNSPNFHGKVAMADENQFCFSCHEASNLLMYPDRPPALESQVACTECHLYPHDVTNGHVQLVVDEAVWDLSQCSNCHGADFAGGRTSVSCLGCHEQENGPANCTTCHGDPPVDDNGILSTMPRNVNAAGAHQKLAVDKGYACTECHAPVTDLTHTGQLPAEVTFEYSLIASANDYATSYEHLGDIVSGNASCAVYCHSNGRGGPPNQATPEWTADVELTCTACHSIPPAAPHPQVSQCHNCHSNVSPASVYPNDIRFLVEQLHVNGTVEL